MSWESKIEQARKEHHPQYAHIIVAAKNYIEATHALRSNPLGYRSCHGPKTDPAWAEYYRLQDVYRKVYGELLVATDVEYGDNPIANTAWEWRYWKVLARKCCYHQLSTGSTKVAGQTMASLHKAEAAFMDACGLTELYTTPCQYLEKAFPNLKGKIE